MATTMNPINTIILDDNEEPDALQFANIEGWPGLAAFIPRSESEYWLTSLPGQAAIDRRQLFLPVVDAHSGRLWAWDVVPNRWGGHPTRSVSRVAHAHPGASRPQRNSLSRLWPVQIRDHSPLTFSSPRSRNWRKPRPALIWPKTGSTVSMRRA